MLPAHLQELPAPSPAAIEVSEALSALISAEIGRAGGFLSFARYMELALYAPGLGYYSAGSAKLGEAGDFVTAPELSPFFGRCIARQASELLDQGIGDIVELGGGSGALAVELLAALEATGTLPERYTIVELSADLKARQHARIREAAPRLADRVRWADALPGPLEAFVVANEVLDAVPAHLIETHEDGVDEVGVTVHGARRFEYAKRPAQGELLQAARALGLPPGYRTEINLASRKLVKTLTENVTRGALLFVDYGFPAAELYHPQRSTGTLMCHYRHRAHDDPFAVPGLQDITAHVDFTAVAEAALEGGASVLGYTSQAQFLINCGITDLLSGTPAEDARTYAPLASQAQKLLSPAEMGELFKAIAVGRGVALPLAGFARGDRTHTL
ncbi:MAG TPA: SAM-dependent methyltransferase [Burkholderiales bacterium]|nr:SAM-dependent methyltransferase [Burkholderiales bacterium]